MPTLADPICKLDCDLPVDGVATFVLTTAERARDLPHPPVYVAGFAGSAGGPRRLPLHWPLDDIPAGLWQRVRAKATREGISLRALILNLLTDWSQA